MMEVIVQGRTDFECDRLAKIIQEAAAQAGYQVLYGAQFSTTNLFGGLSLMISIKSEQSMAENDEEKND